MAESEFSRARRRIKGPSHSHFNWFRGLGPQSTLLITPALLNPLYFSANKNVPRNTLKYRLWEEKDQEDFLCSCFSCYMLACALALARIPVISSTETCVSDLVASSGERRDCGK